MGFVGLLQLSVEVFQLELLLTCWPLFCAIIISVRLYTRSQMPADRDGSWEGLSKFAIKILQRLSTNGLMTKAAPVSTNAESKQVQWLDAL